MCVCGPVSWLSHVLHLPEADPVGRVGQVYNHLAKVGQVPECSSPPKPYLKQQAPGTRWRTWGETLTFALFESTFGKEQVQLVPLEDAIVAFPLRNELQRPADPGSHTPGSSFPLSP